MTARLFQECFERQLQIGLPPMDQAVSGEKRSVRIIRRFPGWNLSIKLHSETRMVGHRRIPAENPREPRKAFGLGFATAFFYLKEASGATVHFRNALFLMSVSSCFAISQKRKDFV